MRGTQARLVSSCKIAPGNYDEHAGKQALIFDTERGVASLLKLNSIRF